jgi:nicotinamide mononucleotide transporter
MEQFLAAHWLDILTTILGLAYIILEYRASIWLWVVGFAMQSLGIVLYYQKGLYADCGMEFYYLAMTVYGFYSWRFHKKPENQSSQSNPNRQEKPVTHFKKNLILPWVIITLVVWGALYMFLVTFTDSRVPVADSFTTALSFVGIWALARKYLEQWLIWIIVDIVTCLLYFYKDIPFKASLYGLYVVIAVMGYFKWKRMMKSQQARA